MHKGVLISVAALLAACGVAGTTSDNAADAQSRRVKQQKQPPPIGFQNFEEGGMAGCFDPNLSGYARAAAERAGGVPCSETSQGAAALARGGDNSAVSRNWLVGLWVRGAACNASVPYMRLRREGSYETPTDAGTWRLARAQIVFSYRELSDQMATAQMEAAAPLRNRSVAVARLPGDRLSLAGIAWRRCSPDADFYLE